MRDTGWEAALVRPFIVTGCVRCGHGLVVPLVPFQLFRPGFTDKMRGSLIVLVSLWPSRA